MDAQNEILVATIWFLSVNSLSDATYRTGLRKDNVSLVWPLGAAVLAAAIGRRLAKVQTGIQAGGVDVVVPGKETHGGGVVGRITGWASKYPVFDAGGNGIDLLADRAKERLEYRIGIMIM